MMRHDAITFPGVEVAATIDDRSRLLVVTVTMSIDPTAKPLESAIEAIQLAESELGAYLSAHDEPHPEE